MEHRWQAGLFGVKRDDLNAGLEGRLSAARLGLAGALRQRLARPCEPLNYEHVPERNARRAGRIDAAGRRSEKSLQDLDKVDQTRLTATVQRRTGERRDNSVTLALSLDTSGSNSVVESRLPKPLVAGSIPVSRSTFLNPSPVTHPDTACSGTLLQTAHGPTDKMSNVMVLERAGLAAPVHRRRVSET